VTVQNGGKSTSFVFLFLPEVCIAVTQSLNILLDSNSQQTFWETFVLLGHFYPSLQNRLMDYSANIHP